MLYKDLHKTLIAENHNFTLIIKTSNFINMSSILSEYLSKRLGFLELQAELKRLIAEYNKHTKRYMFVYAADINKGRNRGIDVSLVQEDFYNIQDILRESNKKIIDFYIETPGGSGEAAEEIARFLRNKFDEVNFVIAGEAKSAGTILALSGDNIYMTDTGSLGPIDAQVRIGRSVVSAHDYKAWIDERKEEAEKKGNLNPLDAIMVAQISPGELYGVINSLEFAKDLVKEWLAKYKFKNWEITETRRILVTEEMKKERANQIAGIFCDHTTWRSHGRSLKIEDLSQELLIENLEKDKKLADIVHRIKTVIRIMFEQSTVYKIYYLEDFQLSKTFAVNQTGNSLPISTGPQKSGNTPVDVLELDITCTKCKKNHKVPAYLDIDSIQIKQNNLPINNNIKENNILVCDNCNFVLDLKPIKTQIESQTGRKATFK